MIEAPAAVPPADVPAITTAGARDSNSKFGSAPMKHSRVWFPRFPNVVPSAKGFVGADDNSFELESLSSVRAGTAPE